MDTQAVETTLAQREPEPAQALTPMEMISSVVRGGADPTALDKVTAWAERMQANEARRAYAQAMTNFKAICPTVARHAKGHTNSYATLVDIDEQIRPALIQCQLSPSWRVVKNDKDWIEVECRVTHVMGHSESTPFGGPPDRGPGRNELQARASTISYLERYTLKALLGIVDRDMPDNDGVDGAATHKAQPKSNALTDPGEIAAKKLFRDIVLRKLGVKELGQGVLKTIFENAQAASGKQTVADCATFIDDDSIVIGKDGAVTVVTDFDTPAAVPSSPTDAPSHLEAPQPPVYQCDRCLQTYPVKTAGCKCLTKGCKGTVREK